MKAFLFFILSAVAYAELPRLTVEHGGRRQDLRLDEVQVAVRVEGDFVDTRMTLNFFNETPFNQEGEFRLPLPEGASVNHYALEVNGNMRAATVVEKEQARLAYETIKARNIDPGLVEKMEGNIYRTRIFPVLPKKGKRVSIGYVQPLRKAGGEMVYRLPFGVAEKIGKFTLRIEGGLEGVAAKMTGGAELTQDEDAYLFSTENSPMEGDLVLRRQSDGATLSGELREEDGEFFAYLSGDVPPALLEKKTNKPQSVTVIWDASANAYSRDLKTELEFLGELLEATGDVSVRLLVLHGELEEAGEFEVKGGNWKELRTVVEGVFHDGAADWRKVDFTKLAGDRIIVFGGAKSAFPISQQKADGVMQLVRSGGSSVDSVLEGMARISGGGVIDLRWRNVKEAVGEVLMPELRVVAVAGQVDDFYSEVEDGRIRVFAKLMKRDLGAVEISLGRGKEALMQIPVSMEREGGGRAVRYLWAQRRLDELDRSRSLMSKTQEAEIVAHCKKYGLVSDYTSLIVLERMSDHIQFRIPPPEPELMAAYERGLQKRIERENRMSGRDLLKEAWSRRAEWHQTGFAWMEYALLPRYQRVKKWTDAQTSVFEKEQLAQTNVAEFLTWRKEAEKVMLEGREVATKGQYSEWMAKIDKLLESGKELGREDAALPEEGAFGVSVRGLVKEPQTISVTKGTGLKEAVIEAGGIHFAGTATGVALYRSGKRTIYNLLSEKYVDVTLLPGDMVVVMSPYSHDLGGFGRVDPFAPVSADAVPFDPKDAPAVVGEDLPLESSYKRYLRSTRGGWDANWGASSAGTSIDARLPFGAVPPPQMQGVVKGVGAQKANEQMIRQIRKAQDPWDAYRKRRAEFGNESGDFAKIAELFYKREDVEKARRVLANLYARDGINVPSLRAAAYWMMQFKDYEGAAEIFRWIGQEFPDDALLVLDLMRLHRIAASDGSDAQLGEGLANQNKKALAKPAHHEIAEMAMMERNRFQEKFAVKCTKHLPRDESVFPSDIRIFVSSSDSENRTYLKVTDPTGETVAGPWPTLTGGRVVRGKGVAEFMVRRALPGEYEFELSNAVRTTYQVEIFLGWGGKEESRRMLTLSSDGKGGLVDGGVVEFDFPED